MDFLKEEDLFNKIKSIVLSIYPSRSRKSRRPYPMQSRQAFPINLGLKNFINSHTETIRNPSDRNLVFHAHMMKSPSPSLSASSLLSSPSKSLYRSLSLSSSTSYSSRSDILGDLIGSESGVHLESEVGELYSAERPAQPCYRFQSRRNQHQFPRRKDYPPTLTILTKKDWALTRHYVDGRLLLIEETVKPDVYFEACRDNGRLILKHVTVENNISDEEDETELQNLKFIEEEEEEELKCESSQQVDGQGDSVGVKIQGKVKPFSVPKSFLKHDSERCQVLHRCATYAGIILSDFNLPCNARVSAHDTAGSLPVDELFVALYTQSMAEVPIVYNGLNEADRTPQLPDAERKKLTVIQKEGIRTFESYGPMHPCVVIWLRIPSFRDFF
ncbi:hypothetical protein K2173_027430 [Erythroxylum novogranatense]|uniref:FAF domain-containing protein n=1 Tax=Erythroxylum novogranatense TaxID=1862640 RepID=A0AAV8U1P0_9ROSI|nr:hypothetical protein K2173_027430 [Erythroxylum novogranatense]